MFMYMWTARSPGAHSNMTLKTWTVTATGGSHKWFLGPKETGILYMKRERIPNFAPKDIGYNGEMKSPSILPDDPYGIPFPIKDASKFEMVGQRNDTNLIGMLYTADLMELIGFDMIEKRIKALATRLRDGLDKVLRELGQPVFKIETPPRLSQYHGIIVIKFQEHRRRRSQTQTFVQGRRGRH